MLTMEYGFQLLPAHHTTGRIWRLWNGILWSWNGLGSPESLWIAVEQLRANKYAIFGVRKQIHDQEQHVLLCWLELMAESLCRNCRHFAHGYVAPWGPTHGLAKQAWLSGCLHEGLAPPGYYPPQKNSIKHELMHAQLKLPFSRCVQRQSSVGYGICHREAQVGGFLLYLQKPSWLVASSVKSLSTVRDYSKILVRVPLLPRASERYRSAHRPNHNHNHYYCANHYEDMVIPRNLVLDHSRDTPPQKGMSGRKLCRLV